MDAIVIDLIVAKVIEVKAALKMTWRLVVIVKVARGGAEMTHYEEAQA